MSAQKNNPISPRAAVLILFYNDAENVDDVLKSVSNQTYNDYEIICIDNKSTDNTLSLIKKFKGKIRIIENSNNLGYALAYKLTIKQIFNESFDIAILLNSDVIVSRNWLEELIKSADNNPEAAIIQSKIFLWDKKSNNLANTFGNKLHYLGFGFCDQYKKPDSPLFNTDRNITYASGAGMLIKKDSYADFGEIDDKFFAYHEDTDISWRAKLRGYKVILSAKSVMWHKYTFQKNQRNNWKFFMLERNRLYFLFKNFSTKTLVLIAPAFLFMETGMIIHATFEGYFFDKIKSYSSFLKNIKTLKKDRNLIQNKRIVDDQKLFKEISPVIDFEEIDSPALQIANILLKKYYELIIKII